MLISSWIQPRSAQKHGQSKVARTAAANICLPAQLQATVPECAINCLQSFVLNNYQSHDCGITANLNLLCTTQTISGLTIGEGSLQCVISSCLNANLQTQSGYTICDGMADAIPNLADTITATISAIDSITATESLSTMTPVVSFPAPSADTTAPTFPITSEWTPTPTTYTTPYAPSTAISDGFSMSETASVEVPTISATLSTGVPSVTGVNTKTTAPGSTLRTETRISLL